MNLLKNLLSFSLCLSLSFTVSCASKQPSISSQNEPLIKDTSLITFSSPEGIKRFANSNDKIDFFHLSNQFESQTNRTFCGPTSIAIALNTLRKEKLRNGAIKLSPDTYLIAKQHKTHLNPKKTYVFNRYTYNNVFDVSYVNPSSKVKSFDQVLGAPMENGKSDWGFQLKQLHQLFQGHGLQSETHVVSDNYTAEKMKQTIIPTLSNPNDIVLINYSRKGLGQKGGGHISPVGAYDKESDSFLILDVNPNKADWVWVTSTQLHQAMQTFDTVENRGFLTIQDK